jgi:hypothetical protein
MRSASTEWDDSKRPSRSADDLLTHAYTRSINKALPGSLSATSGWADKAAGQIRDCSAPSKAFDRKGLGSRLATALYQQTSASTSTTGIELLVTVSERVLSDTCTRT